MLSTIFTIVLCFPHQLKLMDAKIVFDEQHFAKISEKIVWGFMTLNHALKSNSEKIKQISALTLFPKTANLHYNLYGYFTQNSH